jgi:hypothetical protein
MYPGDILLQPSHAFISTVELTLEEMRHPTAGGHPAEDRIGTTDMIKEPHSLTYSFKRIQVASRIEEHLSLLGRSNLHERCKVMV